MILDLKDEGICFYCTTINIQFLNSDQIKGVGAKPPLHHNHLKIIVDNIQLYLESEEQSEQQLNAADQASRLELQGPSGMETTCELIALESCFHILHCVRNLTRTPCHLTAVENTVLEVRSVIQVIIIVNIPLSSTIH